VIEQANDAMNQDDFVAPVKAGVQGILQGVSPGFPHMRE
jgi:hypothetical protein